MVDGLWSMVHGLWFRDEDLGLGVCGLWFGVWDSRGRTSPQPPDRAYPSKLSVSPPTWASLGGIAPTAFGLRVWDFGFQVSGFGFGFLLSFSF